MAFSPDQRKALLVGFGLILAAATVVALIWLGTYLPGFLGDASLPVSVVPAIRPVGCLHPHVNGGRPTP